MALAALQDTTTGRTIAWTAISPTGQVPIDFRLGFDPASVGADASLGAWAALVDDTSVWQSQGTQPLLAAGDQLSAGVITVSGATAVPLPPKPTPTPEPTPQPPTPAPTPEPTPGPTATPTPAPTPAPTPVTVPSVSGQTEEQAVSTLEGRDLRVDETKRKYNEEAPQGTATKTDPSAGTAVPPKSAVDLFISKGPEPTPVIVPSVTGQAEAQAVTTLQSADLVVAETKRKYDENVAKGTATKTDPSAGKAVPPRSKVDLYVSKGPEPTPSPTPAATPTPGPTPKPTPTAKPTPKPSPVAVPNVKGMPEADAIVELNDADLKAGERTRKANESIKAGSVIKTDPAGGTSVKPDSKVALVISTGPTPSPTPKPVAVPDVRGLPEPDAIITITGADLSVGDRLRKSNDDVPAGYALKTDPTKGTKVPPGTLVDLFVSSGPASSPSLVPTASPSPAPTPAPQPSPTADGSYPTTGTGLLSGVLAYREPVPATPKRQVILSLLEVGPFGTRAVPVTQYVAAGTSPQAFVLGFDWAQIDPAASYRVMAAMVDGPHTWISREGTPAITQGAPTSGLIVPLSYRADVLEGEVSGIIIGTPADLSPNAFREVFLVRGDSGAVIGYDARRVTDSESLAFAIPFLLEDIDEAVTYLVVARVTDGLSLWTGPGVPVITQGAPYRVAVPVTLTSDPSVVLGDPVPEVSPSPQASTAP